MDSKVGSFNAYLEYAQRRSQDSPSRPASPAALLNLLSQLKDDGTPISKLADLSGMSAPAFQDAIKKLADSEFITVSGPPLSEIVKLTGKGRDAAALL